MKATFEFDLPDELNDYEIMGQAQKSQRLLWNFCQQLRSWRKYHNDFKDGNDALSKITDEFYRLVDEHKVNIDL